MRTLLLILLCALTVPAQKIDGKKIEKWEEVDNTEGVHFFFAPESIRRNGDIIRVWERWDFHNGSGAIKPGTNYSSVRIFATFDCRNNQTWGEDILFYDQNGKLVKSGKDNSRTVERRDTFGYAIFEYLCERRSQFPNEPPKLKP